MVHITNTLRRFAGTVTRGLCRFAPILAHVLLPLMWVLCILKYVVILIKAIKSQLNLKPYFYSKSQGVGTVGCIIGGISAYLLFTSLVPSFGINLDTPIRQYDDVIIYSVFAFGFVLVFLCLYLSCSFCSAIYFYRMYRSSAISKNEYLDIVLKGLYPRRWQKR